MMEMLQVSIGNEFSGASKDKPPADSAPNDWNSGSSTVGEPELQITTFPDEKIGSDDESDEQDQEKQQNDDDGNSEQSSGTRLLLGPPGFNCWFSSAPVFQWCCSTPQGSPGVGRNTFLSSPHLCFIIVFICDLFVSRDDPLMS